MFMDCRCGAVGFWQGPCAPESCTGWVAPGEGEVTAPQRNTAHKTQKGGRPRVSGAPEHTLARGPEGTGVEPTDSPKVRGACVRTHTHALGKRPRKHGTLNK